METSWEPQGAFPLAPFPAALPPLCLSRLAEQHTLLHGDTFGSALCRDVTKSQLIPHEEQSWLCCGKCGFVQEGGQNFTVQDPVASPAAGIDKATQHGCVGIRHRPLFHSPSDTQSS